MIGNKNIEFLITYLIYIYILIAKMGQKSSQPTKTLISTVSSEPFEYVERIYYISDQQVVLFDTDNYNIEKQEQISYRNAEWTYSDTNKSRLVFVGIGVITVSNSNGRPSNYMGKHGYRGYVTLFDKELKCLKRDWSASIDIGTIDYFTVEQTREIQALKKRYEKGERLEEHESLIGSKIASICPEGFDFSSEKTEKIDKIILIRNQPAFLIEPDNSFVTFSYCQHDNILATCTKVNYEFGIQTWETSDNKWKMKNTANIMLSNWSGGIGLKQGDQIHGFESSRKHLFLEVRFYNCIIIVLDKTLLVERYRLNGCHPVYRDDYCLWSKNRLDMLKSLEVLKKISGDILSIILSFV